ncbi:DUF4123 domain-containing protein [Brenneria sp. g21c3]|uniref:DUF4123 domain-containing protein n=1 Tax=Brenneria sp. g21c3 TaxID=3093893 RepID=UPI002EAB7158|nr:DUF4123 domain-containing protein [Brenneria sp. g21c3]
MNISTFDFSEEAIARLTEQHVSILERQAIPGENKIWLLIEPTLKELSEVDEILSYFKGREYQYITFPHEDLKDVFKLWLVSIDSEDKGLLTWSMMTALNELDPMRQKEGYGRTVCGWLMTSSPVDYLIKHIGETAVQRVMDNGSFMLRFFDPTVISQVSNHMDDWQRSRLFGAVNMWYFLDGDGQLVHETGFYQDKEQMDFSLSINVDCWEKIKRAGILTRILHDYRIRFRAEPRVNETIARRWLDAAMDYLSGTAIWLQPDVYLALGMAILTKHPGVYHHSAFSACIVAAEKTVNKNYQPLLQLLENADWNTIIDECQKINDNPSPFYGPISE